MRWAKVPEWLLDALVAVPRDERRSVAPGTALAGFVALSVRSNFRTGEARVDWPELAVALDVTPRAARRVVELLGDVGALRRVGDRWFLAVDRRDLQVTSVGASDPEVTTCDPQVRDRDLQVTPTTLVSAGQAPDLTNPPDAQSLSEQGDVVVDAWGLPQPPSLHLVEHAPNEQMVLSAQVPRSLPGDVEAWLHGDRSTRLDRPVSALSASDAPGDGAHLLDAGGTRLDDAGTDAGSVAEPSAGAVAR